MAGMRRQRGSVRKNDREDRLHPAETLARVGQWLVENVDDMKLRSVKRGSENPPTPGADGQSAFAFRSNLFPDEVLSAAQPSDSPEQTASLLAIGHMMEASKPGHAREHCRACAVSDVIRMLQMHAGERPQWDEEVPFLKQIEDLVQQIDLLHEAARRKMERLEAWAATPVAPVHGVRLSRSLPPSFETWERMNRVLEYARDELQWVRNKRLSEFASPDHAGLARANPPQRLIKDITKRLSSAGFSDEQIARLVVDRPELKDVEDAEQVHRAFRAAVGRVRKRREQSRSVADGEHDKASTKRPSALDASTTRHRRGDRR